MGERNIALKSWSLPSENRWLRILLLVFAVLFLCFGLRLPFLYTDYGGSVWLSVAAVPLAIGLAFLMNRLAGSLLSHQRVSMGKGARILLLLCLTLLPRLWVIYFSGLDIYSDYSYYQNLGIEFARGNGISDLDFIAKIAPNVSTYGAVLGLLMRVFGESSRMMQLFCLLLYALSVLVLDGMAREVTDSRRSLLCSVLFALLPETILYSAYPGIEYITLLPMLLAMYCLMRMLRCSGPKSYGLAFAAGLAGAFSCINRANVLAALAGAALWLVLTAVKEKRGGLREWIIRILAFGVAFAAVYAAHSVFQARLLEGYESTTPIGWALYEGMDKDAYGGWTAEKHARMMELMKTLPAGELQKTLFQEMLQRVSGYSFWDWLDLFSGKGAVMWFTSSYCINYPDATTFVLILYGLANMVWYAWMTLWTLTLFKNAFRKKLNVPLVLLCLVPVALTVLWHLFATSIPRYHYMVIPFILLLPLASLPSRKEERT